MGLRKLDDAGRAAVRDAYETTATIHEIAKRFSISTRTVMTIARELGAPARRSLSKRQQIIRLFQQGQTVDTIAHTINSRRGYVTHVLEECGLTAPNVDPAKRIGMRDVREVRP